MQGKLLVVDDELFVREMLAEYFTKLNYQVRTAGGARDALKLLETDSFEVALIDLRMPEMGGLDLLRIMKESAFDSAVVLMTGYPTVDFAVAALRDGACDFVIKPFRLKELSSTVARAIQSQQQRHEITQLRHRVVELEATVSELRMRDVNDMPSVGRRRFSIVTPAQSEIPGVEEPILTGVARHRIREVTLAESLYREEQTSQRESSGSKATLLGKNS
jgi:DNA-binding NtrC family response regulator